MKIWIRKRLPLLIALSVTLVPLAAQAQRKSPLADAPAIRKRLELRDSRLEFGAGLGTTLNQDFYHTAFANIKLGFHLTDWLSISGFADFAVANISTGFRDRVIETLPTMPSGINREPTSSQAAAAMSQINQMFGGQLEFTPFTGKYSLFGKLFAHYDFYISAGGGALNIAPTNAAVAPCNGTMFGDCPVSGIKPGFVAGLGMHTFFNQWLALNVELRDILASINPAGRDVNGDGVANAADQTLSSTFSLLASLVVYLPTTADVSP